MLNRLLLPLIQESVLEKIVLISGPRQVGKTTLSKSIYPNYDYLNFDDSDDRLIISDKKWDRSKPLIIFDEIHKMKEWKRFLKGIYDKEGIHPNLIVTGSAKLDTFRKVGDSLAGRYYRYRLHPLDLKELVKADPTINQQDTLNTLLAVGGFPEPFLKKSETHYKIWRKTHQDIILRHDLIDLERVSDISAIETLLRMLRERVGSPVSYSSLARDLQVSHNTIKRWITILENLFVIFKVTPYHRNIARSLLKEPKYYFYDTGSVIGSEGSRLENLVACALLKELHYLEDSQGVDIGLHYLRNTSGEEVDFLITIDQNPIHIIEVKESDTTLSKHLIRFSEYFKEIKITQIVKNTNRNYTYPNKATIVAASEWLSSMPLM